MTALEKLKKRARALYRGYNDTVDRANASCGLNLLAAISPDVYRAAREFNKVMDEIAALDPGAPKDRLSEGT